MAQQLNNGIIYVKDCKN